MTRLKPPIPSLGFPETAAFQPPAADNFTLAEVQHALHVCKKKGGPGLDGLTNQAFADFNGHVRLLNPRDTRVKLPRMRQLHHAASPVGTSIAGEMIHFSKVKGVLLWCSEC